MVRQMGRRLRDFLRRDDGVVAVIFAVMAIPFIAMAGWAVDYLRIQHVRQFLQAEVDSAALDATYKSDPKAAAGSWEDAQWDLVRTATLAEIGRTYQGNWASNVEMEREWIVQQFTVRVTASADVPLAFINLIPGIDDTQRVTVSAVAEASEPDLIYSPPEFTALEFEAWDFNRIWLYCYWPDRPLNDPLLPRRTQMVPIADNGGSEFTPDPGSPIEDEPIQDRNLRTQYENRTLWGVDKLDTQEEGVWRQIRGGGIGQRKYTYLMPQCPRGSHLSMRLENVINALEDVRQRRVTADRWDRGGTRNNYYSDTVSERGKADDHKGLASVTIVETIICDTLRECKEPPRNGGLIPPRQTGRTPQTATEGCTYGRYMYYGWEDRPPERGGSDRDYDDIRVIMACPEEVPSGERNARLIG